MTIPEMCQIFQGWLAQWAGFLVGIYGVMIAIKIFKLLTLENFK